MKTLLLLLLACTLTPSAVFGHGYIVNPEMTWVVNPFYDKNAPAAFYDASSTFGQNPLDIYPNLRHIVAQDTPYTNIPLIAANANKNCGMTSTTGPTRTISGYLKFDVDPSALHEGPCEVWVDDVRTMVARSCKTRASFSSSGLALITQPTKSLKTVSRLHLERPLAKP
ncbi:hypothetical protein L914_11833 [Phytophthora nicotianae]|uniref:Glycosyl hydrolase family 81 N-terminal domain-containing protein n=1 Tax=Phytophthora nicotianae TaxID=4792 RepID=W2N3N9_PHYNI|nr:hypothetical protein L914_11833 [Phytophthora nicotianae]